MLRRVDLVKTHISEESMAFIIGVRRMDELETTLALNSNCRTQYAKIVPSLLILFTLMMEGICSYETSFFQ
jgi:hypothetical protein